MIAIRQFDAKDLADILQIEKISFSHPYNKSTFLHLLSAYNTGFLVAEHDGKVIGYIIYSADHSGAIVSIAVNSTERRKGIGSKLLREAISELISRVKTIELQVSANNIDASVFYSKHGFKPSGIMKNYYPDGSDAILMKLNQAKFHAIQRAWQS
ncbi:MAG: ribosomal protein S18-alanine N-acetyltransferase [Thaumarchaeota archaeon]|nr:ribosomal protein S18-alanine N-acetyltransferase [Nitrososphaerota archaeon]